MSERYNGATPSPVTPMTPLEAAPLAKTEPVVPPVQLTVSERAAQEIRTAMAAETEPYTGLRLGLEAGGCSGYQYALGFAKAPEADDVVAESNGIKVFFRRDDATLLQGATVDYVDTPMGSGFHIRNPNARSSCGCGNSFEA